PRVAFAFAAPRIGRGAWLPGIWRVEGSWETQRYGTSGAGDQPGSVSSASTTVSALNIKEDHAHGGIGLSRWLPADLRWSLSAGLDSWTGSRRAASVGVAVERRILTDRIAIRGDATTWMPLGDGTAFHEFGLGATFRSSTSTTGTVVTSDGGIQAVSA